MIVPAQRLPVEQIRNGKKVPTDLDFTLTASSHFMRFTFPHIAFDV
jgi:hypothetical protein